MSRSRSRHRVVVVGAGIAGSLITAGLMHRDDLKVICLERGTPDDHAEAGTGLNIGPNAMKCLAAHMPGSAETIVANSLPWRRWSVALTNGRTLMDLDLATVADNAGIRIRWAELYALLRAPIASNVIFGADVMACGRDDSGLFVRWRDGAGDSQSLDGVDLLIAGDGRYSVVRQSFFGSEPPSFLGVCLYRLLFPVGDDCPIGDYGQWFNGPNRLLAFRVPGGFVYCAGSFPIAIDGDVPEEMKTAAALRRAYTPEDDAISVQAGFLVDAIEEHFDRIHWARLQEGTIRYAHDAEPVLLVGDASHPMVPTLGQGATQTIEDACVVIEEVVRALDGHRPIASVLPVVEMRRRERIQFVVEFSREATDTMLAGADPTAGTLRKLEPPFQSKLARLYRDVPMPTGLERV